MTLVAFIIACEMKSERKERERLRRGGGTSCNDRLKHLWLLMVLSIVRVTVPQTATNNHK